MSYFEDVLQWHYEVNQPIGGSNSNPATEEEVELGVELVKEEFGELMEGLENRSTEDIADGAADLVWVCCGLMVRLGIDLDSVWQGVKRANFAKVGGPVRADGKLLKPEGWRPPDTFADVCSGRLLSILAPALSNSKKEPVEYCWESVPSSPVGSRLHGPYATIEECLSDIHTYCPEHGGDVYTVKYIQPEDYLHFDVHTIADDVDQRIFDDIEGAEDVEVLDDEEAQRELNEFITRWARKHLATATWTGGELVKQVRITAEFNDQSARSENG